VLTDSSNGTYVNKTSFIINQLAFLTVERRELKVVDRLIELFTTVVVAPMRKKSSSL
jgi:hypothetical protein